MSLHSPSILGGTGHLGEFAQTYFKEVLIKHDSYWFRSVRSILGLAREYGNEAVNLSLARALQFHVTDTNIIKRIVTQQLYLLDIPPRLLETNQTAPSLKSQDRDLEYYQKLIT